VLALERVIFGALLLGGDIDFTSRFLPRLIALGGTIDKAGARSAFLEAVREAARDADQQTGVRARDRFLIFGQLKELERSARGTAEGEAKASTAWHRTVSRLEAYVDLGMLEKAAASDVGAFEYRYKPTAAMHTACDAMRNSLSQRDFLRDHLMSIFYATDRSREDPTQESIVNGLASVVHLIKRPIASYPVDAVVLGVATWLAGHNAPVNLGRIEDAIVRLAKDRPEVLRLGSGTEGTLPETVSINRASLRGLSE
jgi:hypothetical protein